MSSLFFDCPHCKMILKKNAEFCPICGSDEKTGWAKNAEHILEEIEPVSEHKVRNAFMKVIAIFLILAILIVYR